MTDTIEIGLKILPQHLRNQKYTVLDVTASVVKTFMDLEVAQGKMGVYFP